MDTNMEVTSTEYETITCSIEHDDPSTHTEEIVVSTYDVNDLSSENITSSQSDDQMGQQVLGYLEVQPSDTDNATIILQPQGIEIDGQHLILTQGEEGNEIIVVVSGDQDSISEQTVAHFTQSSAFQSIESSSRSQAMLVNDDSSGAQVELIETEISEIPQTHNDIHQPVYIEQNGKLTAIRTDISSSLGNSVEIGSPIWTVNEKNVQVREDNTEMLFIPTPSTNRTSSLLLTSPENEKTPNLMQLACIAQEIHSANQIVDQSPSEPINYSESVDSSTDHEKSSIPFEQGTIVSSVSESLMYTTDHLQSSDETYMSKGVNSSAASEIKTSDSYFQEPELHLPSSTSDIPTDLSRESSRPLDNTVSVIHATSSEFSHAGQIEKVKIHSKNYIDIENQSNENFQSVINYKIPENVKSNDVYKHDDETLIIPIEEKIAEENNFFISSANEQEETNCTKKDNSSELSALNQGIGQSIDAEIVESNYALGKDLGRDSDVQPTIEEKNDSDLSYDVRNEDKIMYVEKTKLNEERNDASESFAVIKKISPRVTRSAKSKISNIPKKRRFTENLYEYVDDKVASGDMTIDTSSSKVIHTVSSDIDFINNTSSTQTQAQIASRKDSLRYKTSASVISFPETKTSNLQRRKGLKYMTSDNIPMQLDLNHEINETKCGTSKSVSTEIVQQNIKTATVDDVPMEVDDSVYKFSSDNDESPSLEISMTESSNLNSNMEIETRLKLTDNTEKLNKISENTNENVPTTKLIIDLQSQQNLEKCNDLSEKSELLSDKKSLTEVVESDKDTEQNKDVDATEIIDSFPETGISEETLVKPPKKTYTRKSRNRTVLGTEENKSTMDLQKIELFSCEELGSEAFDSYDKEEEAAPEIETNNQEDIDNREKLYDDDIGLLSDVRSKVSATYKRKKVQNQAESNTRKLRTRTSGDKAHASKNSVTIINQTEDLRNGVECAIAKNNDFSTTCGNVASADAGETSPLKSGSINSSEECILPLKKRRPKVLKSAEKHVNSFDKLIRSSHGKHKDFKKINRQKLKEKVKKQYLAYCDPSYSKPTKRGRPKKQPPAPVEPPVVRRDVEQFVYHVRKYNFVRERVQNTAIKTSLANPYTCSNCNFSSFRIDNVIIHSKMCLSDPGVIDYTQDDINRRERIRGEDTNDSLNFNEDETSHSNDNLSNGISRSFYSNNMEAECSKQSGDNSDVDLDEDMPSFSDAQTRIKFGFSNNDVVWVKVKNTYWPALVCRLYYNERKASVLLIDSPIQKRGLKVKIKKVLTFNDAKVNKKILEDGLNCPDPEKFLKATQTAENFCRKRKTLTCDVRPKQFFGIDSDDNEEFQSDSEDSSSSDSDIQADAIDEDMDDDLDSSNLKELRENDNSLSNSEGLFTGSSLQYLNEHQVDNSKVFSCLLEGIVDEHLVGIYNEEIKSDRHAKFFSSDPAERTELKQASGFGCIDREQHGHVFEYFHNMFRSCCSYEDSKIVIPYIYEVWIPEAIIKAIALVQDISMEDAELIFENSGSFDQQEDISIKDIEKLYE